MIRRMDAARVALVAIGMLLNQAVPAAPVRAGEYVSNGGGRLIVKPRAGDGQGFSIESIGGDAQMCSLDGTLREGRAELAAMNDTCVIEFSRKGAGLQVTPTKTEACRSFCGPLASFDALYTESPAGCTKAAIKRTRDAFLPLYRHKQYALARAKLAPVLSSCGPLLFYVEEADVRNDLAVTLYHLGERAACREVLEPLRAKAETSDEALRSGLPPADAENYLLIAGKTRTNLKLCRK